MKKQLAVFLMLPILALPLSSCAKTTVSQSPAESETISAIPAGSDTVSSNPGPVSSGPSACGASAGSFAPSLAGGPKTCSAASVASAKPTAKPAPVKAASAVNLMSSIHADSIKTIDLSDDFLHAGTSFSLNLLKNSYVDGKSCLLAPLSAFTALGMAANGAGGNTLAQFETVLGGGLSVDRLDLYIKSYLSGLTPDKGSGTALQIADSLWVDSRCAISKNFLQKNADYFGGAVFQTDFASPSAAGLINQWISAKTNGLITKGAGSLSASDAMVLVNAMGFNAPWEGFKNTHSDTFTPSNGKSVTASFMENKNVHSCHYISDANAQGALISYLDSRFAFAAIMPNVNMSLGAYIRSLDAAKWAQLLNNPETDCQTVAELPKFSAAFDNDLKSPLTKMGLSDAFTSKANFSGAAPQLYISRAEQNLSLKIDETRTTAAAAAAVREAVSSFERDEAGVKTVTVSFNRPFLYAVVDKTTNLPLFIGAMENPQA